jgi:uncharacterized protein involved in exopolysaccharide biosynthesis
MSESEKPMSAAEELGKPQRIVVVSASAADDGLIDFAGLGRAIMAGRWLIVGIAVAVTLLVGVRAVIVTPVYAAKAVVSIAQDPQSGLGGLLGSRAGGALASIVGIAGGGDNKRAESIALLTSRTLTREFIHRHELMPVLFADRWDQQKRNWRVDKSPPPTENVAIDYWLKKVLSIVDDRKTGLIEIAIEWRDRQQAAAWVNELIDLANEQAREQTIDESRRSIEFLQNELEQTSNVQVRAGIGGLLEASLNRITLANAQRQFALKVVDAAIAPDEGAYAKPHRVMEAIFGAFFGVFLGCAIAVWRGRRHWLFMTTSRREEP